MFTQLLYSRTNIQQAEKGLCLHIGMLIFLSDYSA